MGSKDNSSDVLPRDNAGKPYELEDVDALFQDMRRAIEENGKRTSDEIAAGFAAAAASLGTHGPKLVNPRSPDKPFTPENTEPEFRKHYSGDGKYGRYAKALLKRFAIATQVVDRNFAERLEAQSDLTALLEEAFERVFGPKALGAVKSGLQQQKENIGAATAHHENYPMIFVPGPDQDLVLTPITAFSALSAMYRVKDNGFKALQKAQDAEADDPGPVVSLGTYHRTEISDKPQNVAINIPKNRLRFFAQMPDVLKPDDAKIYSWTQGGKVPRMRDREVAVRLERYAELLQIAQEQTLAPSAMSKIDALADSLISDAHRHIDQIMAKAGADAPARPSPAVALYRLKVSRDKRTVSSNALRSPHFQDRVGKFEVAR